MEFETPARSRVVVVVLDDLWLLRGFLLLFLMFFNCQRQIHKTVSINHDYKRKRRAEADSNRLLSAYQPSALPQGQINDKLFSPLMRNPFNYMKMAGHRTTGRESAIRNIEI